MSARMRLAGLLPMALTVCLATAATAAASIDTEVSGGVLNIVVAQDGSHVKLIDHGAGGLEVESNGYPVTGCSPACSGFTSIHFAGSAYRDELDARQATKPVTADAGDGDDLLVGSPFADVLRGENGDDVLLDGNAQPDLGDRFDGGDGLDLVSYAGRAAAVRALLPEPGGETTDNGAAGEGDRVAAVEDLTGGAGDDVLTGNGQADAIDGGPGADELHGGGGADDLVAGEYSLDGFSPPPAEQRAVDRLFGEDGDDTLTTRDGAAETVDCGPGQDVARTDLDQALDTSVSCEGQQPQAIGRVTLSGPLYVGTPVTASGVSGLGDPAPAVTYVWNGCGRYGCGRDMPFTGDTYTPTDRDRQYPNSGLSVTGVVRNAYGTDAIYGDHVFIGDKPVPILLPPQPIVATDPVAAAAVTAAPFSPKAAARGILGAKVVRLPALSGGAVTGYRAPGVIRLLADGGARTVAALACGATTACTARLTPTLLVHAAHHERRIGLAVQRLTIAPGTAKAIRIAVPRKLRAQLRGTSRVVGLQLRGSLGDGARHAVGATLTAR